MTKSMIIAVVVLAVLFAGCGVFIGLLQREETVQQVQHFLIRHRLQNNISFETARLPLSDEAALTGV